jgi:hypothetical protein
MCLADGTEMVTKISLRTGSHFQEKMVCGSNFINSYFTRDVLKASFIYNLIIFGFNQFITMKLPLGKVITVRGKYNQVIMIICRQITYKLFLNIVML